jgi:formylglycine-generating enzyme required for sulfatase activity
MRRISLGGAVLGLGLSLAIVGCASTDTSDPPRHQVSEAAGRGDDICAPGQTPDADEFPDAPCAIKNEYYVADLTDAEGAASAAAGNVGTQTLHTLDTPGTARASCNGKAGAGYTTCGAGGENCCRTAAVPAGAAGTIQVANGFELGVYEVTTARFTAFVDAFGGNLRGAASAGQLPGYAVANASKLPATRAAVDEELGPACKFRSDVANYGARTWPSSQITQTVASFITDDNARAADIRADATAPRLMQKPVDCVSYYMAAAFCAWDGGRLPTNAEWAYTALGGSQLREYPWGSGRTADKLVTDLNRDNNTFTFPSDFPYYDNGFNAYHIAPPGRKPAGASRWGHEDMGGNVLEWTADITGPNAGIVRGGSWEGHEDKNSFAYVNYPLDRTYGSLGFRCAYGAVAAPPPPPPPPAAETAPIHRSYNAALGDHLQGLTQGEGAPAYRYEAVSFKVQKVAPANSSPLYRCRMGSFHFLSNAATCEGQTREALLGYVWKTAVQNSAPVYRCRSANGRDHLSTQTPAECTKAGFVIEGTQGYALRP